MSASSPIPTRWAPHFQGLARIVFGFLLLRHGMEQVFGFPEASAVAGASLFEGVLKLMALPGGLLLMLGLFVRPVALVLSVMYLVFFFVGPLPTNLALERFPLGARGAADPALLNWAFFLYLAVAGGGAWSLDRRRDPGDETAGYASWAPQALALLRIVAAFVFLMHGLEKWFGVGGARIDRNLMAIRGFAGLLENVGSPLLMLGLFTRTVAFILSGMMAVAYFMSWAPRGFWESFSQPNMEASILFCFLYLFLWSAGPGCCSIDGLWKHQRERARA